MSFNSEKLKIMIRKNVMRIIPSITLKATDGRTGCKYVRTLDHVFVYHALSESLVWVAESSLAAVDCAVADTGGTDHPAAMNNALVSSKGAATNSKTLKIRAKIIELTA